MKKALTALTAGAVLTLTGACGPDTPLKTPQQVWIEAHPTYLNADGQCMEADDEPCDEDPYDLDDFYKKRGESKKPSPRPMKTAVQPAPKKTRK